MDTIEGNPTMVLELGLGFKLGTLTSILAGDEVNPVSKLDLEAAVAHKILEPDPRYNPGPRRSRIPTRLGENPSVCHLGILITNVRGERKRERVMAKRVEESRQK